MKDKLYGSESCPPPKELRVPRLAIAVLVLAPIMTSAQGFVAGRPHSFAAAFGFGSMWISTTGTRARVGLGSVQRIDPATNAVVATITVGPAPRFLAAGEGGVWTLNRGDGTVSRIDPSTNTRIATLAPEEA